MASQEIPALAELISALRRPAQEVQLTDAMDVFLQDPIFAREFLNLALTVAGRGVGDPAKRARRLRTVDGSVVCRTQEITGRARSDRGRCDLWLEIQGPRPAMVAIEVKLWARYQTRQRERYIAALRARTQGPRGLLVITARPQTQPPLRLIEKGEWLGETTWARLDDAGLAGLSFSERDGDLARAWPALLKVMRSQGDLGGIGGVDLTALGNWTPDTQDAKWTSIEFLEGIADDAERVLAAATRSSGLRPAVVYQTSGGARVYARSPDYVEVQWGLSRNGSESVELLLSRGAANQAGPQVNLEVWFVPRRGQLTAAQLRYPPRMFKLDEQWGPAAWVTRDSIGISATMTAGDVRRRVLRTWRSALNVLDGAAAFKTLRRRPS